MFTEQERASLRDELIAAARTDERIIAAALTGSGAVDAEDEWSDIDLAFGLEDGVDQSSVIADWTEAMYGEHGVIHHTDVKSRGTVYRVFLLASTLQVDIAFAPRAEFGARAATFRLLFGEAVAQPPFGEPAAVELIGTGWLYALHARSSIARGKVWQAEYMISGLRDQVLALACLRLGFPSSQGRGLYLLPPATTAAFEPALVRSLDPTELTRAFRAAVVVLLSEIDLVEPALGARLDGPLTELAT